MTARFIPSQYPGGRILLRSGTIDVGAVFPPAGEGQHRYPWVWRLWAAGGRILTFSGVDGRAKTELAAWRTHLAAMGLQEIHDVNPEGDTDMADKPIIDRAQKG